MAPRWRAARALHRQPLGGDPRTRGEPRAGLHRTYRELIDHYGLRASRNFPGNAHENGDVESANGGLKSAIDQRLRLRGSRAFVSREAYEGFLEACVQARKCDSPRSDRGRARTPASATGATVASLPGVVCHSLSGERGAHPQALLLGILATDRLSAAGALGATPTYEAVRAEVRGPHTPEGVPFLNITAPDLTLYDRLLGTSAEAVCA